MRTPSLLSTYLLLALTLLLLPPAAAQPPSFSFTPNQQSGIFRGQAQLDGTPASGSDWVAAFDSLGNCAGASQLLISGGIAYINLPIYGDDLLTSGVDEGINAGERFFLQLWDSAANEIYDYPSSTHVVGFSGWVNANGAPLPGYQDPSEVYDFQRPVVSTGPTAEFTASAQLLAAGGAATFDASGSTGNITRYDWSFSGASPQRARGVAPGPIRYNRTGTYEVQLIVSGPNGSDTLIRSQYIAVHPFIYTPTNRSAIVLGTAQVNGQPSEVPDVVAAFDPDGNCAGWANVVAYQGQGVFTLVVYGDDPQTPGVDEGIDPGEDFRLKLWDASSGEVRWHEARQNIVSLSGWANTFGFPLAGYDTLATIYNFRDLATDTLPLAAGWNLISSDLSPAIPRLDSVILGLRDTTQLQIITGFEQGAVQYAPGSSVFPNTLDTWKEGHGYWVRVAARDTLVLYGDPLPATFKRDLDMGWNITGFVPQASDSVPNYFDSLLSRGSLDYVLGFRPTVGNRQYNPNWLPFQNNLYELENGYGYWVRVNQAVGGGQYRLRNAWGQVQTPVFEVYQGYSDLPEALVGEPVLIRNEAGEAVAAMEVQPGGLLFPAVVYGDDPFTAEREGVAPGERLTFEIGGQAATASVIFGGDLGRKTLELSFRGTTDLAQRKAQAFSLFPNPFQDKLYVAYRLIQAAEVQIDVLDMLGRPVANWSQAQLPAAQHRWQWSAAQQTPGVYLIQVHIDGTLAFSSPVILNP